MSQLITNKLFYQNKPIDNLLVLGLGISSQSMINYLSKHYAVQIYYYDDNRDLKTKVSNTHKINNIDQIKNIDLIIASPSFDLRDKRFDHLKNFKRPIICDIELFSQLTNSSIIAVTGTNGKSTVTSLIEHLLTHLNINAKACGNIGVAVFDVIEQSFDVLVIELSSFQIDLLKHFSATIGVITNISEDHLDRYADFKAYQQSKLQLVNKSRYLIALDSLKAFINKSDVIYYNQANLFKIKNDQIVHNDKPILALNELSLYGKHNHLNILASLIAVEIYLKIKKTTIANVDKVKATRLALMNFQNLASRSNLFANYNNISWIDDSKGTNIGATKAAISGFCCKNTTEKHCILILGGLAKGADFSQLQPEINQYIKAIYLFGKDQEIIHSQIKHQNIHCYNNLDEVVSAIDQYATSGDIVLFSPACASFDQFDNYLKRGQYFKLLVERINNKKQMET